MQASSVKIQDQSNPMCRFIHSTRRNSFGYQQLTGGCVKGQSAFTSSMMKMIGNQRLLDSLQNFNNSKNIKKNPSEIIQQDRYIPNRKELEKNYKSTLQKTQENFHVKDPQCIEVAQLFNQSILTSKQIQPDNVFLFRNHNLLKYKPQNKITVSFNKKQRFLCPPITTVRKINRLPFKVLDAPALQDDFYLNLIDWSLSNQIAVALGNCIYLWNASNSKVTKLCEISDQMVTSVVWSPKEKTLAIGCDTGVVEIWDVSQEKIVRKLQGHQMRVGSMAWSSKSLATGSKDKSILLRDLRISQDFCNKLQHHTQQICGLKWSFDEQYLASGGNDNKVIVWSQGGQILNKFLDHKAAVKAVAWSPHQHGVLATGGGTADKKIKIRNIFNGSILCEKNAGSQICNLAFSKSVNEIVSTHGYSQNQINIWSYPNMKKVASLMGHTQRILYLAMSPNGSTIVTGAGDQTLRFWNIFPPQKCQQEKSNQKLFKELSLR